MKNIKALLLKSGIALSVAGAVATPAHAANWLMLQGTEPDSAAPRIYMWGFVQAQYQKDYSDPNATGGYIPPKLVGPNLTSQSQFNVNRARLGARGTGFPLDSKVNYFIMAEFGNNAATSTHSVSGSPRLMDASITLNEIPGARIRVGLFKTPGFEEGLQGIPALDYINFTTVGNQLMLERFPNSAFTANVGTVTLPVNTSNGGLNQFDQPVGAFRDVGVQVFDSFRVGNWDHSYAIMIGNGNGISPSDVDNNKDTYLYWSSELVFGGEGPFRDGLKLFAWSQNGKRLLDQTNDSVHNPTEFDRKRSGVGVKYLKKPWRFTAEYLKGDGMIWVGPDKATFDQNANPAANPTLNPANANGATGKADGWYVEGGWYLGQKWELDLRYDQYTRLKDDQFESVWKTWTVGTQYHFNKKSRLTINYSTRDVSSPNFGPTAGPNAEMSGIGNILAAQVTHIF
ncbi:MAG: phosphate-selective porin O and P [Gammaproteobacteria bacterium]|nr:phosphate-selective porin O and P [Gammaproteobacteria bacterium]